MLRHIFIFDNGTCVHTARPLCNYKIINTIIITLLRKCPKKNVVGTYFRHKTKSVYECIVIIIIIYILY